MCIPGRKDWLSTRNSIIAIHHITKLGNPEMMLRQKEHLKKCDPDSRQKFSEKQE